MEDTCNTQEHGEHFEKYAALFADIDARASRAPVDSYDVPLDWIAGMSPDANHGLIKNDSRR